MLVWIENNNILTIGRVCRQEGLMEYFNEYRLDRYMAIERTWCHINNSWSYIQAGGVFASNRITLATGP